MKVRRAAEPTFGGEPADRLDDQFGVGQLRWGDPLRAAHPSLSLRLAIVESVHHV